ncbi:hypothetical protein BH11PLA2_BH11PLA2_19500 [soil metagenome]
MIPGVISNRWRHRLSLHSLVLFTLVIAQFFGTVGYPLFDRALVGKDTSRPFPCMNRPCGCATYDECWAGDCCCFTMAEKLAWARANDITPPSTATSVKKSCCESEASCCAKPAKPECPVCAKSDAKTATVHWVNASMARKCQGKADAGPTQLPVSIPPTPSTSPMTSERSLDSFTLVNDHVSSRTLLPAIPPPKSIRV